jgi:uncharacterized protein DUF4124
MLVIAAGAATAETYKWTDDKGVTHYTDKIPPEQVNKSATVLDKQARPIKQIDPPPTPAQRAAKEAEVQQQEALARTREESARQDRALMQSFTSVDEIELSKGRAIGTLDAQLQSAHAYITQLEGRRADVVAKKASYGSKTPPDSLDREIASIDVEVQRQKDQIALHQQEKVQVGARYDAFETRWREIKAEADAKAAAGTVTSSSSAQQRPK